MSLMHGRIRGKLPRNLTGFSRCRQLKNSPEQTSKPEFLKKSRKFNRVKSKKYLTDCNNIFTARFTTDFREPPTEWDKKHFVP